MQHATSRPFVSKTGLFPGYAARQAMARTIILVALLLLSVSISDANAQDRDMKLTATFGLDYSNGSYGTDRNTDVLMGLSTLSLEAENLKFDVTIPYMRISGRGLVVFDAAGNPTVINRRTSITPDVRTGFGDLNLAATYSVPPAVLDNFEVRITGRLKLPTASARRRISTGRADFGMSIDVSKEFGIWGPFVTVGYLIPGQPRGFSLYNTVSVSAGTSIEWNDHLVAIFSYDFDSESSPLLRSSQETFGSLSWVLNDRVTLTGYGTAGLSSGSPGIGAGLLMSYGLN